MEKPINIRPSYFLTICGFFAIFVASQVLASWIWLDMDSPDWKLAWCNYASPVVHWRLLYAWAISGIAIAPLLLRGMRLSGYGLTIFSYTWFWTTVSILDSDHEKWGRDSLAVLFFGGLMIWSYYRYWQRLTDTSLRNSRTLEPGVECEIPETAFDHRIPDNQNPYAAPFSRPPDGG